MAQEDLESNIEATTALLRAATAQPLPAAELCFMLAFNMVVPPTIRAHLIGRADDYRRPCAPWLCRTGDARQ